MTDCCDQLDIHEAWMICDQPEGHTGPHVAEGVEEIGPGRQFVVAWTNTPPVVAGEVVE